MPRHGHDPGLALQQAVAQDDAVGSGRFTGDAVPEGVDVDQPLFAVFLAFEPTQMARVDAFGRVGDFNLGY